MVDKIKLEYHCNICFFLMSFQKNHGKYKKQIIFKPSSYKKRLQKLVSKPSFESFTILNKDLVRVKNKKVKL